MKNCFNRGCGLFLNHSQIKYTYLIILFVKLFSLNASVSDVLNLDSSPYMQDNLLTSNSLADTLISLFKQHNVLKTDKIFIDYKQINNLNIDRLNMQKIIIENHYSLVDDLQFADFRVLVTINESVFIENKTSFFRQNRLIKKEIYQIKLTRLSDSRVLAIKDIESVDSMSFTGKSNEKWYTPFLITFVIGSLIYLLYYSNN